MKDKHCTNSLLNNVSYAYVNNIHEMYSAIKRLPSLISGSLRTRQKLIMARKAMQNVAENSKKPYEKRRLDVHRIANVTD
jgi:adenine-specific DNA methylase